LPELLAITNKLGNRPRTQFFEGFEWLKKIFEEVLIAGETMKDPYLSFVWADTMDPKVERYIEEEFIPQRKKSKQRLLQLCPKIILNMWNIIKNFTILSL
jgi:hypothetical protein